HDLFARHESSVGSRRIARHAADDWRLVMRADEMESIHVSMRDLIQVRRTRRRKRHCPWHVRRAAVTATVQQTTNSSKPEPDGKPRRNQVESCCAGQSMLPRK